MHPNLIRFPIWIVMLVLSNLGLLAQRQIEVHGPFAGKSIALPDSGEARLVAFPENANSYAWKSGWKTPVIFVRDSGWVWVDVEYDGRRVRDSIYVQLPIPCVIVPVAVSPNDDAVNDCLQLQVNCALSSFKLIVFNRWGQEMFQTTDAGECWDLKTKGQPVAEGSYFFTMEYEEAEGGVNKQTGTFIVVR